MIQGFGRIDNLRRSRIATAGASTSTHHAAAHATAHPTHAAHAHAAAIVIVVAIVAVVAGVFFKIEEIGSDFPFALFKSHRLVFRTEEGDRIAVNVVIDSAVVKFDNFLQHILQGQFSARELGVEGFFFQRRGGSGRRSGSTATGSSASRGSTATGSSATGNRGTPFIDSTSSGTTRASAATPGSATTSSWRRRLPLRIVGNEEVDPLAAIGIIILRRSLEELDDFLQGGFFVKLHFRNHDRFQFGTNRLRIIRDDLAVLFFVDIEIRQGRSGGKRPAPASHRHHVDKNLFLDSLADSGGCPADIDHQANGPFIVRILD